MPLPNSKRQFPTNRIQLLSLEQLYTPQDSHGRLYTARYERKGIQQSGYVLRTNFGFKNPTNLDSLQTTSKEHGASDAHLRRNPTSMVSALGPSHANPRHSWRILNECPPPLHVVVKMGQRKANTRYSIGICSDLFRLTHDYLKNESNSTSNFSHCHLRRYYFC